MFRSTFLKWRTNAALKSNKNLRSSIPYQQAKSVGIIFSVEDRAMHDAIKELIRHLEGDGKTVSVLEFLPAKKDNYEFLFDFFTIKDLSFWGKIDSAHAEKFINSPFDYVFYIDSTPNVLVVNVLARCKAHCRIGKYVENGPACFELMINSNGSAPSMIENMYKYAKALR